MIITQVLASLTLTLIPTYVVRCRFFDFCQQASPIPLTLLEVFILSTFTSWIVWRLYLLKKKKTSILEPFQGLSRPFIIAVSVFLLAGLISVFVSPTFLSAAGIFKAYFVEVVLLGLVVYDLSRTKKSIVWMTVPLVFSGVWVALIGIYQQFTGEFIPLHEINRSRASSIYTTSNAVGLYLGPIVFFTLGLLFAGAKKNPSLFDKKLIFFLLSLVVMLTAIFFSGSRGAFIAIFAGSVFFGGYFIYLNAGKALKKLLSLIFVLVVAAFLAGNLFIIANVSSTENIISKKPDFSTLHSRFCLWEKSRHILIDKPFFGSGLSGFHDTAKNYPVCKTDPSIYPHNLFLNFWLEIGVVGLLAFLAIIGLTWVGLTKTETLIAGGILAAIVYLFVHGLVDVPYFKNDLSSEFWVLIAVGSWLLYSKKVTPPL